MEFAEVDDTVKDAIGEICNMLAGAWKGKVPGLSANSAPATTCACRRPSLSCNTSTVSGNPPSR
jgi:hypothetical protein